MTACEEYILSFIFFAAFLTRIFVLSYENTGFLKIGRLFSLHYSKHLKIEKIRKKL